MADDIRTGSGAPTGAGPTLEQALGVQVRGLRLAIGPDGLDLASAAGISVGMLSKIENGLISPSLSTLQAISNVLNVPLSTLFASFEEKRDCSVRAGRPGRAHRAARHQGRAPVRAARPRARRRGGGGALSRSR